MKLAVSIAVAALLLLLAGGYAYRSLANKPAAAAAGLAPATAAGPQQSAGGKLGGVPSADVLEFTVADLLTVEPTDIGRALPITGTLKAVNQTIVKSKVAGEIRELTVREGMPVKRGQRLGLVDPTEFEWRVQERQAQLESAKVQLAQAKRELDSTKKLLEQNFISQNAYDKALSVYEAALAARNAAQANAMLAKRSVGEAVLIAPMSGIVFERFAQLGEKVSPDTRVLSIIDLSQMEVEALVPADEIGAVRVGQTVELMIEGIDQPQTGVVARINPGTQGGTRSVPVYFAISNADPRVRAGMFATGSLALEKRAGVLAVPYAAIRDHAGQMSVYAIEQDRLVERQVQLGVRDDNARAANGAIGMVEVTHGLSPRARIVAVNLGTLRTGAAVRVLGAEATAANPAASN